MSPAIHRVAETVLGDPERALKLSAERLALVSRSSVGSVVRFCQEIGFSGYQGFKLGLAASVPLGRQAAAVAITAHDPSAHVVQKVFATVVTNLAAAARSLDTTELEHAARLIRGARRILVVAAGTSNPLASDFASRLFARGFPASYPGDASTQLEAATRLGPGDVCFAISHSGVTAATIAPVNESRARGATTIALTSFSTAPLALTADHVLVAGCPADLYRKADMASRIAHHTVLNALWALMRHQQQELPHSHSLPSPA